MKFFNSCPSDLPYPSLEEGGSGGVGGPGVSGIGLGGLANTDGIDEGVSGGRNPNAQGPSPGKDENLLSYWTGG